MLSPSRFLWGVSTDPSPDVVAGPRYEGLPDSNHVSCINMPALSASMQPHGPMSPKKGRLSSRDMVSKSVGFVYVCDHCVSLALSLNLT
jgi:hypothetical protein